MAYLSDRRVCIASVALLDYQERQSGYDKSRVVAHVDLHGGASVDLSTSDVGAPIRTL
jgi:hypothetical protein